MREKGLVFLVGLVAISSLSAENRKITIKSSSSQGTFALSIEAEIAGRPAELLCFRSQKSCVDLAPGDYLLVRPSRTLTYSDCINVDVYKKTSNPAREKPIGGYCLTFPP